MTKSRPNTDTELHDQSWSSIMKEQIRQHQKRAENTFILSTARHQLDELSPILSELPENVVLSIPFLTNRDPEGACFMTTAPSKLYNQINEITHLRKRLVIDPMLDFDLEIFVEWIKRIKPESVVLGYCRDCKVWLFDLDFGTFLCTEPSPRKVHKLASILLDAGIKVECNDLFGIKMPEGVIHVPKKDW